MRTRVPWAKGLAIGLIALAGVAISYWVGYNAGLRDKGPHQRAIVLVRRSKDTSSVGHSYTWFDVRDPRQALKMSREEERLKSIGAEYFVAKGVLTSTLNAEPMPTKVNAHR